VRSARSEWAHTHLPAWSVELVRRARAALLWARVGVAETPRWLSIARGRPARGSARVFYGHRRMPSADDVVFGGQVKFQRLNEAMPNDPAGFNVLYLGSTSQPLDAHMLVRLARRRGARFVWNQNGVFYPGLGVPGWERVNRRDSGLLRDADYVFFQSEFCRLSADRFYGRRDGPAEVLYNAVDTNVFAPGSHPRSGLTLLLGGNQYQRYRIEVALKALAALLLSRPDATLLVTGVLSYGSPGTDAEADARRLAFDLGVADRVRFLGPYTQRDAPDVLRQADLLLHTKYNDPCPTLVVEAMACGLPVVYSASGGVPELVGDDAGVGIPAPLDFERDHPPSPDALAAAVIQVADELAAFGQAARARAVDRLQLGPWIERHREVFAQLLG
jgi:glycosyltransferase involved in cell wall biosynthesis